MRKLFYAAALLFVSANMNAQYGFVEGYNTSFDEWVNITETLNPGTENEEVIVTGIRPAGWVTPVNSNWTTGTNDVTVTFEKAENRFGEADKACKVTTEKLYSTWFSWHVSMTQTSSVYAEDYIADPFWIDQGDDFYYSFWAKSDKEGTPMYIGVSQMYDPANGGEWKDVPFVTLTTEWKQYAIYVPLAKMDLTSFSIQLRSNGVRYIDDLVIDFGEIPDDVSVVNVNADKDNFNVASATNGISFYGVAGTVSVYNTLGSMVAQKATDGTKDSMSLAGGLYIVKMHAANGKDIVRKVIVE